MLWEQREAARVERDAAQVAEKADADAIAKCLDGLDTAGELPVGQIEGGICPDTTYNATCAYASHRSLFVPFSHENPYLYRARYEAEWARNDADSKIAASVVEMAATNMGDPAVQAVIDAAVDSYAQILPAGPEHDALVAARRTDLTNSYNERYQAARAQKDTLEASIPALDANVTTAKADIDAAIALAASSSPAAGATCPSDTSRILDCAVKFDQLCADARSAVGSTIGLPDLTVENQGYYHWRLFQSRQKLFEEADARYQQIAAAPSSFPDCASAAADGEVLSSSVADAMDILRRVDRRGILQ
jgi:hypothetical protein